MGYYYEIAVTGVPEVDAVGFAVERAGKAYHHTRDWNEKEGNGRCVVDDIDDALKACAARIAALEAEVARVRDNQQPGEPVAWALLNGGASPMAVTLDHGQATFYATANGAAIMPLYPHPRPRVGVTEAARSLMDAYNNQRSDSEKDAAWTALARSLASAPTASGEGVVEYLKDADGSPVLVYMVLDQHNTPVEQSQDEDHANALAEQLANDEQQLRVMRVCLKEVDRG